MNDTYRAFRQFERFFFDGVPEQPEPRFGRNTNANVSQRNTGKTPNEDQTIIEKNNLIRVRTIVFHSNNEVEVIEQNNY